METRKHLMPQPVLLASYPRSGSTWLRFIFANIHFNEVEHDIDSVNRYFPGLDGDEGIAAAEQPIRFLKTHMKLHANNVIFLHRHIGDVLTSEWWYKKKFHDDSRSLHDYLVATGYGEEWREHVDWYYPARWNLAYQDINNMDALASLLPFTDRAWIDSALHASSFQHLQKVEEKGFGIYPAGNPEIKFFRSGKSDQWHDWEQADRTELLWRNRKQLTLLGYGTEDKPS